ncbi:MAG: hypothetical protein GX287_06410 [Fusobacteria bacterium]|nr:hypothetical protein [Fusobacteriota bacterium]
MKLNDIAKLLNASIITCEDKIDNIEVDFVGAADLMSEVLAFTKENSVLLTGLTTPQVIRTAQMVELSAIIFVRGKMPLEETINLSKATKIPLLVTNELLYTSCGKLYEKGLKNC